MNNRVSEIVAPRMSWYLWRMIFKAIVTRFFKRAGIECDGSDPGDPQIRDPRFYRRVLFGGSVGLGDSYMEGWWECERIDLFIEKLLRSGVSDGVPRFDDWVLKLVSRIVDRQDRVRSLRVAKEHYDNSPEFYVGVLGEKAKYIFYTCAFWKDPNESLEEAQLNKADMLCQKAGLKPGMTILDIGCGWGGFLAYAADTYGTEGIGLSISEPQIEYARQRYSDPRIDFRLQDYRDFKDKADAVVSICMIEHVGPRHHREYFQRAYDALAENGRFALQCILSKAKSSMSDPWLDKRIFPGGNLLMMDQLKSATKGLFDIVHEEFFPDDYVRTLTAWCDNMRALRDTIVARYGIEHFRMYEYYFMMCAGGFRSGRITVGQFVLVKAS